MSDQMAEAMRNMAAHRAESMRVDRGGWTREQWVEDARRLMNDVDGSVTSLVNGHVMALLGRVAELGTRVAALEAGLEGIALLGADVTGSIGPSCHWHHEAASIARALLDGSTAGCAHDSVDTFASGAGRRVDVCMGCDRVLRHWTEESCDA